LVNQIWSIKFANKKGLAEANPLQTLVGRAGFEPATNGLKVRGSFDSLMFMEFVCY